MDDKEQWKVGDEIAPFHPDASHVPPDYRDGWNACYRAMQASRAPLLVRLEEAEKDTTR